MDKIWNMKAIRAHTTEAPLDQRTYDLLIEILFKAEAMGILKTPVDVFKLDAQTIHNYLRDIANAGLGKTLLRGDLLGLSPKDAVNRLNALNTALEESPVTKMEWAAVRHYLTDDQLAALLGDLALISIRRYAAEERATPDDIAARLHMLALIIGDLKGSYNDAGVRNWFNIPRAKNLRGKSPIQILKGNWSPTDEGPIAVRQFAKSLGASFAT
jgi:hypothetical protein